MDDSQTRERAQLVLIKANRVINIRCLSARTKQRKETIKMRTYLYCRAGFVKKVQWLPSNSWVN